MVTIVGYKNVVAIFSSVIFGPLFRIAQKTPAFSFFLSPYDIAISQRAVHVVVHAAIAFQTPFKNGSTEQHQTMTQFSCVDIITFGKL